MKMLQKELYRHISMFHFYTPTKTPESISMHTKMKFSIKDFFSDQILRKLRIWLHLLRKFLMENFTFMQCLVFWCFRRGIEIMVYNGLISAISPFLKKILT